MESDSKLTVEPLPSSTWGNNARSFLPRSKWDKIRKAAYKKCNNRCRICYHGGKGKVDLHEVWEHDFETKTQKLVGMIVLCKACHECKHFGRAQLMGKRRRAKRHLMKINGWTSREAESHIRSAFMKWENKDKENWKVDMSILDKYNV